NRSATDRTDPRKSPSARGSIPPSYEAAGPSRSPRGETGIQLRPREFPPAGFATLPRKGPAHAHASARGHGRSAPGPPAAHRGTTPSARVRQSPGNRAPDVFTAGRRQSESILVGFRSVQPHAG